MILDFNSDLTVLLHQTTWCNKNLIFCRFFFSFTLSIRCNLSVTEPVSKDKMVTWDHVILRHGKPMAEL